MTVMSKANQKEGVGQGSPEKSRTTLVWEAFFLVWAFCLMAEGVLAAPFIPTDDAQVLERLPVSGDSQARELGQLRKALAKDPENLELAIEVARRYLKLGRAESDPRYHGYAQAALRPWWEQKDPSFPGTDNTSHNSSGGA